MKRSQPTNQSSRGTSLSGKQRNLQCDYPWGPEKQQEGARKTHIQSSGSGRVVDQHGRHGYPPEQYDRFCVQNSGSRRYVDLQHGGQEYPSGQYDRREIPVQTPNLDFYRNEKLFEPNGVFIEELLTKWKRNYTRLEDNHFYIQWLFPLPEPGRNPRAKPLTPYEIELMKKDKEVMSRFKRAYELMLGFYGIKLQDKGTGKVTRETNYRERFENLNTYSHNNLRITRILKSLALLGHEHFQAPLVRFFLEETLRHKNLQNVKNCVFKYFLPAIQNENDCTQLARQFGMESSRRTRK